MVELPAEWGVAEERARTLVACGGDMAQVQELLVEPGISVIGSIWVTRQLIDSRSLAEAKEVVLTSTARTEEAAVHTRMTTALEQAFAIAEVVRELGRPAVVAIDGPGDGPRELADGVAMAVGDAEVVSTDGLDLARLRDEVLVTARAGQGVTLVHGMFLLRPELAPYFHYRVYLDAPTTSAAEDQYLRTVWPQRVASLVIKGH